MELTFHQAYACIVQLVAGLLVPMFHRRAEAPEAVPLYPTRYNPDTYTTNEALVEAALITIRTGLMVYYARFAETSTPEDLTLDEVNTCMRGKRYASMGMYAVRDGYVLEKITRGGLVDYSHRLKVPTEGSEPNYHRDSFNEDIQAMPAKPVDVTGIREMSRCPAAVVEVLSFERDVVYSALHGWAGYGVGSTLSARC